MKRVNQKQAVTCISKREPFKAAALTGDWFSSGSGWPSFGWLPQDARASLTEVLETGADVFVVLSYATPVAWFSDWTGGWEIPEVKYSPTTSKHQTYVRQGAV